MLLKKHLHFHLQAGSPIKSHVLIPKNNHLSYLPKSISPSAIPSSSPSTNPSDSPSTIPSYISSTNPSDPPSTIPSGEPSTNPSGTRVYHHSIPLQLLVLDLNQDTATQILRLHLIRIQQFVIGTST